MTNRWLRAGLWGLVAALVAWVCLALYWTAMLSLFIGRLTLMAPHRMTSLDLIMPGFTCLLVFLVVTVIRGVALYRRDKDARAFRREPTSKPVLSDWD